MGVVAFQKRERRSVNVPLVRDQNPEALAYIQEHLDVENTFLNILATSTPFNVEAFPTENPSNLVNLKRINDIRYVNKFFEAVNAKLDNGGTFIGCFESKEQRQHRVFEKHYHFTAPFFLWIDFVWKRVIPKLPLAKKMYFGLTKGYNRVLSVPEVLGRLISCGFKIIDYKKVNAQTFFTVKKITKPVFDLEPTYGPLVTLKRVGMNGKIIRVYKLRTMHPYSEYLQAYIYRQNSLQEGGKFKDDFRITNWGKIFRKLWLDELPMIYNWLSGDMKLVGVRPISQQYLGLYPKEFQNRRQKYKPGLVPPFYVDLPSTFDKIIESEKKYLDLYDKNPFTTDIKYLFKALYNIFIKRARSK
jgi:lipopolysaccharide/colanic/teichoic acid biosynthesis glycosyltransferase